MARTLLLIAASLLALAAPAALAQSPVSLAASVEATAIRLEVTGPPRAGFAVLVSPRARGGFFCGHPVAVEYLHPVENVLGGGRLDAAGRGTVTVACRADDLGNLTEAYAQAVAFAPDRPREVLGVSGAYRLRPGPPPVIEPWRPSAWRVWLLLLAAGGAGLFGVWSRRRGRDPGGRFAVAAALIVVVGLAATPVWPRRLSIGFLRDGGLSQSRADASVLGDRLAAALAAMRLHIGGADAAWVRFRFGEPWVAPRVLRYHLYPLSLLHSAAAVDTARRRGAAVLLLSAAADDPPPAGFVPVAGFTAPGYRLYRSGDGGRP